MRCIRLLAHPLQLPAHSDGGRSPLGGAACACRRVVAVDGRLLFDEFQTQDGGSASRIYIVAERVEFLASRKPSNGQASDEASPDQPATGEAREAHEAA